MKDLWPWIKQLKQSRNRMLVGTGLIALTVMAAVALLGLSGYFITATGLAGVIIAAGGAIYINIYTPAGGIRAFALIRTVSRYIERIYNHNTVLTLLSHLRVFLFSNLGQLSWHQHTGHRHGQWLNRLTHDVTTLDNLYLRLLAPPVVAMFSSFILVFITAIWLPQAAMLLLLGLLFLLCLTTYLPAMLGRELGLLLGDEQEQLRYRVLDHLNGLPELRAAQWQQSHGEKIWQLHEKIELRQKRLSRVFGFCQSLSQQWLLLLVIGLFMLGIQGYLTNSVSGPIFVMLILATLGLNEAFMNLSKSFSDYGLTLLSAKRLASLSENKVSEKRVPTEIICDENDVVVVLQSVSFDQGADRILNDINMRLNKHDTALITGSSGSGKSTLAKLMVGWYQPTEGKLFINGKTPKEWPPVDGLKDCYWLSQDNHIFSDTIANNLRLANPGADDDALWCVLDSVCMADRIEQTHLGLNSWIGEAGMALSGGEIQRLILARALLATQSIILMDEPFKGVDSTTAKTILGNIDSWMQGKTIIWFAHSHSTLPLNIDARIDLS